MSGSSSIEWTDATWNPVTGCTRVSPGCAHCYIERTPPFRMEGRRFVRPLVDEWAPTGSLRKPEETTGVRLHPERLEQPLHWRKPRRVFVNSLSDLFHEEIPFEFVLDVFETMSRAPQHVFQVLTKRPERMREFVDALPLGEHGPIRFTSRLTIRARERGVTWALPNVWLGVSIENARHTWRADVLREIPAAVRFISAEPLLGSLFPPDPEPMYATVHTDGEREAMEAILSSPIARAKIDAALRTKKPLDLTGIDWVIAGGESGPGARGMDIEWVRELAQACNREGVAYFVKQLGAAPYETRTWVESGESYRSPLHLKSKKGGDPDEWPVDLRVRRFPQRAAAAV